MVHQVDVICKNEFSLEESAELAQDMLRVLHRLPSGAAGHFYYSTPTDGGGFRQDWRTIGKGYQEPKYQWVDNLHVYFSFNPHRVIPKTNAAGEQRDPRWVRGTERNIVAINALFCDADAKDYITQDEWMPFYAVPDVTGMTKQQAHGALQKAETAAVDAALVVSAENFEEYKRRALAAIMAAPVLPTYLWCSGGGWQAAWALDEPLVMTDDNFANVKRVVKAWVTLLGADPGASDLNRILRMPGTVNRKKKYGPNGHQVRFTVYVPDRTYTFAQLAALVADVTEDDVPVRRVHVPAGITIDMTGIGQVAKLPRHPAIDIFNAGTNQRDLLLSYGYTDGGDRMTRPGGERPGVRVNPDNTSNHFDYSDPLYSEHRITPAHVLCAFEYGGSVDKMLAALTGCDRPLPGMTAEVAHELRAFAQSAEARKFLRRSGIRKPEGYTRTAEALIEVAERAECWLITPGMRQVGEICNASHESVRKHITALNGTWWQVWQQDGSTDVIDLGLFYWASVAAGGYAKVDTYLPHVDVANEAVNLSVPPHENGATNTPDTVTFQRSVLPHDAFIATAYRYGITRRQPVRTGRGLCVIAGKRSGVLSRGEAQRRKGWPLAGYSTVLLPGLGNVARPTLAAIVAHPDISRQEIADMYGLSVRTLSKVLASIERLQVSEWMPCTNDDGTDGEQRITYRVVDVTEDAYGAKHYTATKDAMRVINALLPTMATYKANARRAHANRCVRAEWLYMEYAGQREEYKRRIVDHIERSWDAATPADTAAVVAVAAKLGVAALAPVEVHKAQHSVLLASIERRMDKNDGEERNLRAQLLSGGIKPARSMSATWLRWDTAEQATVQGNLIKLLDELDTWRDGDVRLTFAEKVNHCKWGGYSEDEIRVAMFARKQAQMSPVFVAPDDVPDAADLDAADDDGINLQTPYVHNGSDWVAPAPVEHLVDAAPARLEFIAMEYGI